MPQLRAKVPTILLEGDAPATTPPPQSAPTAAPVVQPTRTAGTIKSLPDAYGTRQLKLTPRDPHWLNAHWDFTRQQLRNANEQSAEGHLILRMFKESAQGPLVSETHVHPESTRWMVHVPQSGTPYAAEIGFYDERHAWSSLAASRTVSTPPSQTSADQGFELATLTAEGSVERHGSLEAIEASNVHQTAKILSAAGLAPGGSLGLAEGFPGSLAAVPSPTAISSWSPLTVSSSWSSPMVDSPQAPFRLEVNAELIVHGATEPDATLQLGDQIAPLNADGTFQLRFALPDGAHEVSIKATSARTAEQRMALLRVGRRTETSGTVGSVPREPGLKPPGSENL